MAQSSKPDEKFWKDLWNEYSTRSFDRDKANMLLEEWKIYKEKIEKGNLKLEEYTNLISDENKQTKTSEISSYLTNFLERETQYFGYSKGFTSNHYMIKRNAADKQNSNSKNETYYVKKLEKNAKPEEFSPKENAEKIFTNDIKPLLKTIVEAKKIDDLRNLTEDIQTKYDRYEAKQVLDKILVLNSLLDDAKELKYKFLFIYKKDALKKLYEDLSLGTWNDKEKSYEKNLKICKTILNILGLQNSDLKTIFNLSAMLWDYAIDSGKDFPTEEEPNVIFYGAPGTGKTYGVEKYLTLRQISEERCIKVQFHPSFTYEDFIEGIKPTGIDHGIVKLELVNGIFKDFCKKAKDDRQNEYFFIADEINRANLSSVFGEILSLLEADYRDFKISEEGEEERHLIETQYSQLERSTAEQPNGKTDIYYDEEYKGLFGIPRNIRFIGMMNDVDKSIDSFDLALRRRFKWIRKDCDYDVIVNVLKENNIKDDDIEKYKNSCEALNKYISEELNLGKSYEFGHSFFLNIRKAGFIPTRGSSAYQITETSKENLFDKYLKPTLQEYLRGICESDNDVKVKIDTARKKFTETKETKKDKNNTNAPSENKQDEQN